MADPRLKSGAGWLAVTRRKGDRVVLSFEKDGEWVTVNIDVNHLAGGEVRLAIQAPRAVRVARIDREEIATNGV
jgi:sRNA-binding carbon storage regulator CsrA